MSGAPVYYIWCIIHCFHLHLETLQPKKLATPSEGAYVAQSTNYTSCVRDPKWIAQLIQSREQENYISWRGRPKVGGGNMYSCLENAEFRNGFMVAMLDYPISNSRTTELCPHDQEILAWRVIPEDREMPWSSSLKRLWNSSSGYVITYKFACALTSLASPGESEHGGVHLSCSRDAIQHRSLGTERVDEQAGQRIKRGKCWASLGVGGAARGWSSY
jgi:hypothetical protein